MSLRSAASQGVRFTTLAVACGTLVQVGGLVVLGRLLQPSDFGLVAMMVVVFGFADMLAQMGVGDGIVQHPQPVDSNQLSTLFWTNCLLGVGAYGVVQLSIPLLVAIYGEPELGALVPVASLSLVVTPLGIHVAALLRRALRFKLLAALELGKALAATGTAIAGALLGWGVWALVAGQLAAAAFGTAALLIIGAAKGWLPRLRYDAASVREILRFGAFYFGSNVVNYFNSRIDQLLIGSLLGARALGYYSMAFNLVSQPTSKVNQVVTQVAFPIMAQIRDDAGQLNRWYLKLLNILATVNAPMLLGLAAVAPLLVPLVLGDGWAPSLPLVQILAILFVLRSAGNAGGTLMYALGRSEINFRWNCTISLLVPAAVFLGAKAGGLAGVAAALALAQVLLFFLWFPVVRRVLPLRLGTYAAAFLRPTALAALMALAVWLVADIPLEGSVPARIAVLACIGAAAYLIAYRVLYRAEFDEYLSLLRGGAAPQP
ncbi:MAG: MOP flippase family protein [Burkholderiales bacterium]